MKKKIIIPEIATILNNLASKIALLPSAINDTSFNIYAEDIGIKLMNKIYNYELVNANLLKSNTMAIDAIDEINNLFIQITSDSSSTKIKATLEKFSKTEFYKNYQHPKVKFLILGNKKNVPSKKLREVSNLFPNIDLNENDIIDFKTILAKIKELPTEKVELIYKFLQKSCVLDESIIDLERKYIAVASYNESQKELEITLNIIESLIQLGYGVFISCEKLHKELNDSKLYQKRIWLVTDKEELEDSNIAIIKTSDQYRLTNSSKNIKCIILQGVLEGVLNHISIYNNRKQYSPDFPLGIEGEKITTDNFQVSWSKILSRINKNLIGIEYNINDILNLLHLIHPHHKFHFIEKDDNNGYYLVEIHSKSRKIQIYYLILLGSQNVKKIAVQFNRKHKDIDKDKLEIIIQRKVLASDYIENLKNIFKLDEIHYIGDWYFDEFLGNLTIPEHDSDLTNFVDPIITSQEATYNSNDLLCWINNPSTDIAFIVGSGGIGKTTLCNFLYSKLSENSRNVLLFIDSKDLVDYFKKGILQYDLYEIYQKWNEEALGSTITREVFQTQLRIGNLIIIIDGLDEVISTCAEFDFFEFLVNLSEFLGSKQRSKIIISLRDVYITELDLELIEDANTRIFKVEEFDSKRMKTYFSKRFENQTPLINRAVKLANKISLYSQNSNFQEKKIFPPYFIKIIGDIVSKQSLEVDKDFQNLSTIQFKSDFLDESIFTDILINGLLVREQYKKGRTNESIGETVDNQIKILTKLALSNNPLFSYDFIVKKCGEIESILQKEISANRILDHPLLKKEKEFYYKFKYQFLEKYFVAIGIAKALIKSDNFDQDLKYNITEEINKNSIVSTILKSRLSRLEYKNIIIRAIKAITVEERPDFDTISSLFIFLLSFGNKSTSSNTKLLKEVFEAKDNQITNFAIISTNDDSLHFDFSNLNFSNTKIDDFNSFLKCNFNRNTYFDSSCIISNINYCHFEKNNLQPTKENFHLNSDIDNSLAEYFRKSSDSSHIKRNEIIKATIKFFDLVKRFNGKPITYLDWRKIKKVYLLRDKIHIPFDELKNLFLQEKMFSMDIDEKLYIEKKLNTAILNFKNNGDIEPEILAKVVDGIISRI